MFCSQAKGIDDVALVRVEQLSPFPWDLVERELRRYPGAEPVWCQEEPKNMGAWYFVRDRLLTTTRTINEKVMRPAYVGRRTMASPAEGYGDSVFWGAAAEPYLVNKGLAKDVLEDLGRLAVGCGGDAAGGR